MKVIIAGSRGILNYNFVIKAVGSSGFDITEVVSGTARGVDRLGERYARDNNIQLKKFPADWAGYGKGAGFIRNGQMAEYADALIALWDGKSKGTEQMINRAKHEGLKVHVFVPEKGRLEENE